MNGLNEFFLTKLEWTWHLEYAALILIIAAVLALILLITLIVVAVRHGKNKREKAALNARITELENGAPAQNSAYDGAYDEEAIRSELRAEMEPAMRSELTAQLEPAIRRQVEDEYASILTTVQNDTEDGAAAAQEIARLNGENSAATQEITRLNAALAEQEKRIDDLNNALNRASSAHKGDTEDLFRTINDLTAKNKQLQNDVNILRAENSQLKTQARKEAVLSQARQKPAAPVVKKSEEPRTPVKKPAVKEPVVEEDDEDEYDNEFGDKNSLVKVTLKFDRIKQNWVIYRSDTDRAYRRLGTKQDALPVAKDLARRLHAQLVIHKKDGKFQKA